MICCGNIKSFNKSKASALSSSLSNSRAFELTTICNLRRIKRERHMKLKSIVLNENLLMFKLIEVK